jgi:hypothetical protein
MGVPDEMYYPVALLIFVWKYGLWCCFRGLVTSGVLWREWRYLDWEAWILGRENVRSQASGVFVSSKLLRKLYHWDSGVFMCISSALPDIIRHLMLYRGS